MTLGLVALLILAADRKTSMAPTAQPAEAVALAPAPAPANAGIDPAPASGPADLPAIEFKPATLMLVALALPDAPSPPARPAHANPYGLDVSPAPP